MFRIGPVATPWMALYALAAAAERPAPSAAAVEGGLPADSAPNHGMRPPGTTATAFLGTRHPGSADVVKPRSGFRTRNRAGTGQAVPVASPATPSSSSPPAAAKPGIAAPSTTMPASAPSSSLSLAPLATAQCSSIAPIVANPKPLPPLRIAHRRRKLEPRRSFEQTARPQEITPRVHSAGSDRYNSDSARSRQNAAPVRGSRSLWLRYRCASNTRSGSLTFRAASSRSVK